MEPRRIKSATEEVLKDIKELSRYYKPTKCYLIKEGEETGFSCEELSNYLTPEGIVKQSIKVCNERLGKCIVLEEGDEVRVVEFSGSEIYVSKDDAQHVNRWEKIGYLVTRKGEERTIKTPFEGDIVFIQEVPEGRTQKIRLYIKVR